MKKQKVDSDIYFSFYLQFATFCLKGRSSYTTIGEDCDVDIYLCDAHIIFYYDFLPFIPTINFYDL